MIFPKSPPMFTSKIANKLERFTKRGKFILIALLLSLGLLGTQFVGLEWRYQAVGLLAIIAYLLSAWALIEDLKGVEWLTLLILPTFYAASVALFYFLLPEHLLTRMIILVLFGVGMYALLLTENIFSVAAIRTIQLLRAAQAIGFLLTLLTAFFLVDTIFSFRLAAWLNSLLVVVASFPLLLQGVWSATLEEQLSKRTLWYSLVLTLCLGELAFFISFWPVTIVVASLFLVTAIYVGLGLVQSYFSERLFRDTIVEFLRIGVIVLIIIFLITRWG